jgi:hypothetical protein
MHVNRVLLLCVIASSCPAAVRSAYHPSSSTPPPPSPRQQQPAQERPKNPFLRWLAELSLEDYQWRSGIFKETEAERMVETSLARLTNTSVPYVRPMDAPRQGILGAWESNAVSWLLQVIDEEAARARKIVASAGELVRPIEIGTDGPLGHLESQVVEFFRNIRSAEQERVRTKTLRPKDSPSGGGPLGELERNVVNWFREVHDSETLRGQQIRQRNGDMVRPMDVPGPLGEMELRVAEIFRAEQMRAKERRETKQLVRPKDAKLRGPLGQAELSAIETIRMLSDEELERARNIQIYLQDRRPMDVAKDSALGMAEAIVVGCLRLPRLLWSVIQRVQELLQSEPLQLRDDILSLGYNKKPLSSDNNSDESTSPSSSTR